MRILIINDQIEGGGTEIQTLREFNNFVEHGNEAFILTFDNRYPVQLDYENNKILNFPIRLNDLKKTCYRLFSSRYIYIIKKLIKDISPEYIHLNNVKTIPIDILKIVKSYSNIQTLRDFSYICPKGTAILEDGSDCNGYMHNNCLRKCGEEKFNLKLFFKYITLVNVNKKRVKCIDKMVTPSRCLSHLCNINGLPTVVLNNPFDFSILKKETQNYSSNTYLYYGEISKKKGVEVLLKSFSIFHKKYPDSKLCIAGKILDEFKETFFELLDSEYCEYLGELSNDKIMELYKKIYCVVVPSLWIENYPNTVLEAIASKTLVLGSDRGGIPELILNEQFRFNILDEADVYNKLCFSREISKDDYNKVTEKQYRFIYQNNSQNEYYKRLANILSNVKRGRKNDC